MQTTGPNGPCLPIGLMVRSNAGRPHCLPNMWSSFHITLQKGTNRRTYKQTVAVHSPGHGPRQYNACSQQSRSSHLSSHATASTTALARTMARKKITVLGPDHEPRLLHVQTKSSAQTLATEHAKTHRSLAACDFFASVAPNVLLQLDAACDMPATKS